MSAKVTTLRTNELIDKRDARFPDLPDHMKSLPIDERGFPVPWFVTWNSDGPQFPIADGEKLVRAYTKGLCWVCGGHLGKFRASVIGPMCAINRTISEPQCHTECARFSAKHCPFLANPRMGRVPVEKFGLTDEQATIAPAGHGLKRNPGATCVWIARTSAKAFLAGSGNAGYLFELPEPVAIEWYANGREAFREEVIMSIKTGLPALLELCAIDPDPQGAFRELGNCVRKLVPNLPTRAGPNPAACRDCGKATSNVEVLGCTKGECPLFPEETVT